MDWCMSFVLHSILNAPNTISGLSPHIALMGKRLSMGSSLPLKPRKTTPLLTYESMLENRDFKKVSFTGGWQTPKTLRGALSSISDELLCAYQISKECVCVLSGKYCSRLCWWPKQHFRSLPLGSAEWINASRWRPAPPSVAPKEARTGGKQETGSFLFLLLSRLCQWTGHGNCSNPQSEHLRSHTSSPNTLTPNTNMTTNSAPRKERQLFQRHPQWPTDDGD